MERGCRIAGEVGGDGENIQYRTISNVEVVVMAAPV
jgi:hypothetical protein